MKISVIVPIYKTEAYLKRCLDSLTGQTYDDFEIILVDDGSPDNCPALCDNYAEENSRIKVLHKENGGLVSAWQAGVRASNGRYLCFVDSDDWVEKDMLSRMISFTDGTAGEIICCNFVINSPRGESSHFHGLPAGAYEGEQLEKDIKNNLLGHENRRISMSRCMKLISRELMEANMQFSNPAVKMGEDVNIMLPVLLDSRRVVIMEQALYYHYFHNELSMAHKYDASLYDGVRMLYEIIKKVMQVKKRENGEEQCDKEYIFLLFLVLKNEIRAGKEGYKRKIKEICRSADTRKTVMLRPVVIEDKVNHIMYGILKNPNDIYIAAAKLLFRIYDRISRKGS